MVFRRTELRVPSMSVAQNIYLGEVQLFNRLRGLYIQAQRFLLSLNFYVDPMALVSTLGAQKYGLHADEPVEAAPGRVLPHPELAEARARSPRCRRCPGRGRSRTRTPSRTARGPGGGSPSRPCTLTSSATTTRAALRSRGSSAGTPAARRASRARPVSQVGDWQASGRRRSPSSTMKPPQPSTARRSVSSSKP